MDIDKWHCVLKLKNLTECLKNAVLISDGKFGSFYRLGPLSLVQKNEQIFFRVISFFLAKHNSNVTCYFPNKYTTYANVDHTTNNAKL